MRASIPPIVAQLLLARGVSDPDEVEAFLNSQMTGLREPDLLPGVQRSGGPHPRGDSGRAADRHLRRLRRRRHDRHGLLYSCLRLLGANVGYYVPNRLDEGYGLNDDALEQLAGEARRW